MQKRIEAVQAVIEYISNKQDAEQDAQAAPLGYDEYEIILEALMDGGVNVEELRREEEQVCV